MSDPRPHRRHLVIWILLLVGAVSGGCQPPPSLGRAPNLFVMTGTNPYVAVPEELRTTTVDLLYATDRRPEDAEEGDEE